MKKYLLFYAVTLTALAFYGLRHYRHETQRLIQNQTTLATQAAHYRTQRNEEAASVQVLRLRCTEFEELRSADAQRIRELGIRLRRVETAATTTTQTIIETSAPLRDTIVVYCTDTVVVHDTLRLFRWHDPWVSIEGSIRRDSVHCRVECIDTLRQIVHRIPRRFLFFRWGTKALRQEIISTNPHTRIVSTEYIRIEKGRE